MKCQTFSPQALLSILISALYHLTQSSATAIIFSAAVLGMLWALLQFLIITRIPVRSEGVSDSTGLVSGSNDESTTRRLVEIYTAIYEGAESFLRAEYSICARFIFVFGILIFVLVSWGTGWDFARGLFTTLSFVLGAATSIREFIATPLLMLLNYPNVCNSQIPCRQSKNNIFTKTTVSGYLGMKVAVYSNVRTTVSAQKSGWTSCFNTAFRSVPSLILYFSP